MGNQDQPSSRGLGLLILLGLGAIVIVYNIMNPPPPEPPKTAVQVKFEQEQAAARAQAQAESEKAQAESQARHTNLCRWVAICKEYGKARQACATAGDFNNGLNVKLGEVVWSDGYNCANGGALINPQNDTPSTLQCVDASLKDTLNIK